MRNISIDSNNGDNNKTEIQIITENNMSQNKLELEHTRAKDLEFIGVTFMMVLILLIPVNFFLKYKRKNSTKEIKTIGEIHVSFIIVAHILFYVLLGMLLFPPLMGLLGLIFKSFIYDGEFIVYLVFPIYAWILSKIALNSLKSYIDKVSILKDRSTFRIINYSVVLFLIVEVASLKILWGIFGFSYMGLGYGLFFPIGFYMLLKKYFSK